MLSTLSLSYPQIVNLTKKRGRANICTDMQYQSANTIFSKMKPPALRDLGRISSRIVPNL